MLERRSAGPLADEQDPRPGGIGLGIAHDGERIDVDARGVPHDDRRSACSLEHRAAGPVGADHHRPGRVASVLGPKLQRPGKVPAPLEQEAVSGCEDGGARASEAPPGGGRGQPVSRVVASRTQVVRAAGLRRLRIRSPGYRCRRHGGRTCGEHGAGRQKRHCANPSADGRDTRSHGLDDFRLSEHPESHSARSARPSAGAACLGRLGVPAWQAGGVTELARSPLNTAPRDTASTSASEEAA